MNVGFWVAYQKSDIAGEGFADRQSEGLLTLTPFKGIAGHRNIARFFIVVIPTLRDYVEHTEVVVFYGLGVSPARADYNLPS